VSDPVCYPADPVGPGALPNLPPPFPGDDGHPNAPGSGHLPIDTRWAARIEARRRWGERGAIDTLDGRGRLPTMFQVGVIVRIPTFGRCLRVLGEGPSWDAAFAAVDVSLSGACAMGWHTACSGRDCGCPCDHGRKGVAHG
jgi:hypothetical protein